MKRKVREAGFTPREIALEKVASAPDEPGQDNKEKNVNKRTVSLRVTGMACSSCQTRVTEALSNMDCVESVEVDLQSGLTEIECTDAAVDPHRFVEAVRKLGFEGEVRQ